MEKIVDFKAFGKKERVRFTSQKAFIVILAQ